MLSLAIVSVIVLILAANSVFVLGEAEQAIITQFGRPVGGAVTQAGLHFKAPLIHTLHRFDRRILNWDSAPDQIPTADKKYIELDTTARWRIVDPLKFYTSVGTFESAQSRLDDIIDSSARDIVSSHLLVEVVRNTNRILEHGILDPETQLYEDGIEGDGFGHVQEEVRFGREKLMGMILARASELVPQYGIELLDVQIKRLNYIEDVRKKVYERMISERQRIATKYRSEGEGKSAEIRGELERELNGIESDAFRRAREIRGAADAEAAGIYADAYRQDPEFYSFLKTLEVYRESMGANSRAILSTDTDLYRYIRRVGGR